MTPPIRAVLLDVDGTLTDGIGGRALLCAAAAVRELAQRLPIRYVTNTTSVTRETLARDLAREGFPVAAGSVVTPAALARRVLTERSHDRGVLIAAPTALPDLAWYAATEPEDARSVLLASEAHGLTIGQLGPAVDALLAGAKLYTLQQNRLFRRQGALVSDLGPVAAFLAYAARTTWENLGKPSSLLFRTLAAELGVPVSQLAMVGDDAEHDVAGALTAGCGAGVLVRTGKHRIGEEDQCQPQPTAVINSIAELPRLF